MAMAHNNTPSCKLSLSCGGTRCTLQALILLLLASSTAVVVVGMAETTQPPSGGGDCHYRFELTHVDANLSLSSDELMRRAYDRSRLRAATLYGTAADSPAASGGGGSSDSDSAGSPVRSPGYLSQGDSLYIIKFYMDKRLDKVISATVDTGSNLIWTTEKECLLSSTRSVVPCSSDMCKRQAKSQCSGTNKCTYTITYGDDKGTQTAGTLYKDKLTFLRPRVQTFENVAIGCSTSTVKFEDPSIKGIVGLGRGAQSLPGQLGFNKFSYCLNSYYKPNLPSYLLLTTAPSMATGARSGAGVATTGLRQGNDKTRYFVDLEGISIGGTRLDITMKSGGGSAGSGGNMFVDSGASFTVLEESVFNKLVEKVDQIMKNKQYSKEEQSQGGGGICYSSSLTTAHPDVSILPQMVLHFADSADMVLPWDSYLWYTKTTKSSKLCLAIEKGKTEGMSVLGNFQMQGIHMLFDTQNDKLSFVPADCSKV